MSNRLNEYFTTSELAKTCGVTKHTLFHYDDIGLLKPEIVNSKGYRYYSVQQCLVLDLIIVLKKAGSSLEEIKEFIQKQNTPLLINMLKEKQMDLEREQRRIARMQSILKSAIQMTEEATKELQNTPKILECEAESFIVTPLNIGDGDKEFAKKLSEHRDYCEAHYIDHEFPIWTIISKGQFQSGNYYPEYMANKVNTPIPEDMMLIKPAGLYAVIDHKGSYDSMPQTYSVINNFIASKGMNISGNVYALELLTYWTEKNPDDYKIRIYVQVSH
ncbi:MerR family transcriptional regulator [Paenibacillus xylanexedens]|uniref:MerR family transcriptional regulator n=1 Tax=Paenibacillus xylanexedens TaxID=528191 RepID=UPI0011A76FD4|nr:MerR family transcriptional regulator [Paenibacillus xylanexedens]